MARGGGGTWARYLLNISLVRATVLVLVPRGTYGSGVSRGRPSLQSREYLSRNIRIRFFSLRVAWLRLFWLFVCLLDNIIFNLRSGPL